MNIRYARASTQHQNLNLQIKALQKSGCDEIFYGKMSTVKNCLELEKMISMLRKSDAVVVWKLDLLTRSLKHLIRLMTIS